MNLAAKAEDAVQRHGERRTMCFEGQWHTNVEIQSRARRFQRAFADLGLRRGKIAAACLGNDPLVYGIFGGFFRTGATVVPVMSQLTVPQLRYIFGHTEAECIITDTTVLPRVREAIEGLDHIKWLGIVGGETKSDLPRPEFRMEDLLESNDEMTTLPKIDMDDVVVMLYTSGTTGRPKGVMLTHDNFEAGALSGLEASDLDKRTHPMISVSALPMAHIFGIGVMIGQYNLPTEYANGYGIQLRWFDTEKIMAAIQEHKATDLPAVPTMLSLILNHPKVNEYDLTSIEVASVGAAPLPEEVARGFTELTGGCFIRQLYGMTENRGMATCGRFALPYRPGSAGRPYSCVDLRIFDDNDNELPAGQRGEIVTRGPTIMKGYFKNPEATAEAMRGGWLHTGDIGYLDDEGWLFVVDRKKDMIIRGGENIYPAEIESAVYKHPAVAEAAVVGVPDPVYGEGIVAFVVRREGAAVTEQEIIDHAAEEVNKFKAPSKIYFKDELPKSGVSKILRRELRTEAVELAKAEAEAAKPA